MKKLLVLIFFIIIIELLRTLPYINILFPIWFQLIIILEFVYYVFKVTRKIKGIVMCFLWIIVIILLLLKQTVYAEQFSVTIYFLLFEFIINHVLLQKYL